jgi:hypothetical protein
MKMNQGIITMAGHPGDAKLFKSHCSDAFSAPSPGGNTGGNACSRCRACKAEADLAALQRLSPRLAKELAEVIKTGKEEDRFYGLATKISG